MKDTYYFSHDYNARTDKKIKKLIIRHGMLGYGIFWSLIEDLYNNANALPTDYEGIAFDMRSHCDIIKSIINDFELFVIDGENFYSKSVERRLSERDEKSTKARESARLRWNKKQDNANALPTHSERNAIKERKGKKIKEESDDFLSAHSEELKNSWNRWKEYKKSQFKFSFKSADSEKTAFSDLLNLSNQSEFLAVKIINKSIAKGWKGLFAPDKTELIETDKPVRNWK